MTDTPATVPDSIAPAPDAAKGTDHMIPKARLDEEVGKRRALESEYADFAETVLAEIPDNLKPLIPADYGPAQKLKWYRDAKKTGVFDAKPNVPETDRGKPVTTPKDRDFSTLPAHARIAAGYGKA
ncbi:hypothetical protein JT55_10225 [Rhodovulum sp. NI22]|nr:hypothetical protein JT55_10225 [Rhodovulum sp. NI22]